MLRFRSCANRLFIDEAYSLVAEHSEDAYGAEAVQTLLKRMEDDRSRLVVILAGYPEPMDRMLESNPGLKSRVPRHLTFVDHPGREQGARGLPRLREAVKLCGKLAGTAGDVQSLPSRISAGVGRVSLERSHAIDR